MFTISKEANPNYLAKVVRLKDLRKHDNADRLQCISIDFQNVITGMDAKEGYVYVYFPVECAINKEYLSDTNSFRDKTLNKDQEQTGFFEDNGRVKALRLRGEKSSGYIVPIETVFNWIGQSVDDIDTIIGTEFDTVGGTQICKKYVIRTKETGLSNKQGKKPKVSRLIEGQVHLHVDTENLRKNIHKIAPDDIISVTYKTHGTSWWVGNVLVKRKLSLLDRISRFFGANVQESEYDAIYGSRKVVKNQSMDDSKKNNHYYGYDLWEDVKNSLKEYIPKGYTLYGECLGYDKFGGHIQKLKLC